MGGEAHTDAARTVRAAVIEVGTWWAALFGLTVMSISSVGPVDLAVAGAAGGGAAFAARWVRLAAGVTLGGTRGALRAVLLLPWSVVRGFGLLVASLLGSAERAPAFRQVAVRGGTGVGWAGLALAASPDTCVVQADDDGEVRVHALGSDPGPVERLLTRQGGQFRPGEGGPR
ncbi:hypothetical protein [Actinacidiphila acididurans]|uniref:Monovalent cation/H+ antiporter subunit E n=1 Tax=Actinacidiphila acididurans TaxID=2784346 RepID=A0ABS2TYK2_9ACTN|nr:hypothetical protein [Actinacidiphila acididurans]MBM9508408.1 hypothetical protein [Actinacidiphila acididurans]